MDGTNTLSTPLGINLMENVSSDKWLLKDSTSIILQSLGGKTNYMHQLKEIHLCKEYWVNLNYNNDEREKWSYSQDGLFILAIVIFSSYHGNLKADSHHFFLSICLFPTKSQADTYKHGQLVHMNHPSCSNIPALVEGYNV